MADFNMVEGLNISVATVVAIVPNFVIALWFFFKIDARQKTQQEMSDLKFLSNAERIKGLERELGEKILGNATRIDALNQKYDVLNREILIKLSEIEKVLARLQGRFQIFDNQKGE